MTISVKDKDFGAVGDSSADDTASIQAAISSGAKRIYFPVGIYRITATIVVNDEGVTLYGERKNSIIVSDNIDVALHCTFATPRLQDGRFSVLGLTLSNKVTSTDANDTIGLKLTGTFNPNIIGCEFLNYRYHIYFDTIKKERLGTPELRIAFLMVRLLMMLFLVMPIICGAIRTCFKYRLILRILTFRKLLVMTLLM